MGSGGDYLQQQEGEAHWIHGPMVFGEHMQISSILEGITLSRSQRRGADALAQHSVLTMQGGQPLVMCGCHRVSVFGCRAEF